MISFSVNKMLHTSNGIIPLEVSFELKKGQFGTIYGNSGAGKTTILKILAGLVQPESGKINVGDKVWLDTASKFALPPQKRDIGIVFQDFALFPNKNVKNNLLFALPKGGNIAIVDELVDVMDLGNLQNRYPETLSGGQKQRVALARALVRKPRLLLLDEPLSALDMDMRSRLQDHILKVHQHYNLTTILVSHDLSEIFKMSDIIFVLDKGKISKQGSPLEVFANHNISSKFQFTGEVLKIEKEDIVFVVSVLISNNIVKVIATAEDVADLRTGDRVLVASKAFNPIIRKLSL